MSSAPSAQPSINPLSRNAAESRTSVRAFIFHGAACIVLAVPLILWAQETPKIVTVPDGPQRAMLAEKADAVLECGAFYETMAVLMLKNEHPELAQKFLDRAGPFVEIAGSVYGLEVVQAKLKLMTENMIQVVGPDFSGGASVLMARYKDHCQAMGDGRGFR